ncbi:MAG: sugar kinase [Flavobacteriales bacterium]|nr:sugar kinase [Flavobacteriales bacterium]
MNIKDYIVNRNENLNDVLKKIDKNEHGTIFIEDNMVIIGLATDGDIRRKLIKENKLTIKIYDCMNTNFIYLLEKDATKENILKLLDTRIRIIPILNNKKHLVSVVNKESLFWNEKERIISKAKSPVRISFAGGGTDLTTYFYEKGGAVLNATINKFTHAILEKRDDKKIIIHSNDFNKKLSFSSLEEINLNGDLDLIKSVIQILKPDFGFKLITYSDVPPGSGLGGSAVLLSAIIGAFNNYRENKFSDYEIAELAFHAERVVMNLSGGWQDQYATVFGGFNFIELKDRENIVNPLRINDDLINELEDSLLLCYTGINHNSGDIHDEQKELMKNEKQKTYAETAKNIAYEMKSKLLKGYIDDFGELLGKAWETKKKFSPKITDSHLDEIYSFALENGAIGGKLLGAGSGGYYLLCVPTDKKLSLINALESRDLKIETITFDNVGLRQWITKKKI